MFPNLIRALVCTIPIAAAQLPVFEVATVKPASEQELRLPAGSSEFVLFHGRLLAKDGQRVQITGVTLRALLRYAFELNASQISGPGWIESDRFSITAIAPPGTDAAGIRRMLQTLLIERFEITYRRETKKLPMYVLSVAKGGHKLQPPERMPSSLEEVKTAFQKSVAQNKARQQNGDRTPRQGFSLDGTVAKFAADLSRNIGRPVRDATQLTDEYYFRVDYVPEGAQPQGENGATGPYLREAVEEQLGLHLQSAEEVIETLVIEKATRTPVSN